MKAKKENKVYKISNDLEKKRYLKEGFDIYDENGKLLEYSPLKKIAYSEYAKLKEENDKLHEEVKTLEEENEHLRAKVAELGAAKENEVTKGKDSKKGGK